MITVLQHGLYTHSDRKEMAAVSHQCGGTGKLQAGPVPTQTTLERMHMFINVHEARCAVTEERVEARTHTNTQSNLFYLGNLMFSVRAHRTPTGILKSTELLPNNINILK